MSGYTALLDANVLYPAPLRDLLLQLAVADLFRARWSADIHREWIDALMRTQPQRDRSALERSRDRMDKATRDCLVTGYEALIPSLQLPDPGDRHVLAAAITGHCDIIVTQNLRHFPAKALTPYRIKAQHPDNFLCYHLDHMPGVFCAAVQKVRARLKNPPYTVQQYLATLARQELGATALKLGEFAELI